MPASPPPTPPFTPAPPPPPPISRGRHWKAAPLQASRGGGGRGKKGGEPAWMEGSVPAHYIHHAALIAANPTRCGAPRSFFLIALPGRGARRRRQGGRGEGRGPSHSPTPRRARHTHCPPGLPVCSRTAPSPHTRPPTHPHRQATHETNVALSSPGGQGWLCGGARRGEKTARRVKMAIFDGKKHSGKKNPPKKGTRCTRDKGARARMTPPHTRALRPLTNRQPCGARACGVATGRGRFDPASVSSPDSVVCLLGHAAAEGGARPRGDARGWPRTPSWGQARPTVTALTLARDHIQGENLSA